MQLEKDINSIRKKIAKLPEGKLLCHKNGKYCKWFHRTKNNYSLLPKSNRKLAEQLAVKHYLQLKLQDFLNEFDALNAYQQIYNPDKTYEKIWKNPYYSDLLKSYFKPFSQELDEWVHEPFRKNESFPEHLKYESISGNVLRSKSEALIDMTLYQCNIPFRYECELVLDSITLYPDFTIKHPETGEIYYWEHCGLIEKKTYRNRFLNKLQQYMDYGIIPSINLILTYETIDHPLTTTAINETIEKYFF